MFENMPGAQLHLVSRNPVGSFQGLLSLAVLWRVGRRLLYGELTNVLISRSAYVDVDIRGGMHDLYEQVDRCVRHNTPGPPPA